MPEIGVSMPNHHLVDGKVKRIQYVDFSWEEFLDRAYKFEFSFPPEFADWYKAQCEREHNFLSVTRIIGCPRYALYSTQEDFYQPFPGLHSMAFGTLVHAIAERFKPRPGFFEVEKEVNLEEIINVDGEDVVLTGQMDRIYRLPDGSSILIDLKTKGSAVQTQMNYPIDGGHTRQGNFYAYLDRERHPNIKKIIYYYMCFNGWFHKIAPKWEYDYTLAEIKKRISVLLKGLKNYPAGLASVETCWGKEYMNCKKDWEGREWIPYLCLGWENRPTPCPFWNKCREVVKEPYIDFREAAKRKKKRAMKSLVLSAAEKHLWETDTEEMNEMARDKFKEDLKNDCAKIGNYKLKRI